MEHYYQGEINNKEIIVSVTGDSSSPKTKYSLYLEGSCIDHQEKLMGKFELQGSGVKVKIRQGLLGTKMIASEGSTEIKLSKLNKEAGRIRIHPEFSAVMPLLKPGDWQFADLAFKDVLIGDEQNPDVFISYSINSDENYRFISKNDLNDFDSYEIQTLAKRNLCNHQVEYQLSTEHTPEPIMFVNGDDFSSEKILDENFMNQAHEILKSKTLFAAIPRRQTLMICNSQASSKTTELFVHMMQKVWNEGTNLAPITDLIFQIFEGSLHGVQRINE